MSTRERERKSAKERERAQKGANECKRALLRKIVNSQVCLKQPGLGERRENPKQPRPSLNAKIIEVRELFPLRHTKLLQLEPVCLEVVASSHLRAQLAPWVRISVSQRYAERIWGEFFILARRTVGKLPANFSANFDGEF